MKQHFCSAENSLIQYEKECNWCGEKEWVGLTADEQSFVYDQVKQIVDSKPFWVRFADAIEAKLKEKNA